MRRILDRAAAAGVLRMQSWAFLAALSALGLLLLSPQQLGVVLAKINLVAIAAWLGYWIDRAAFRGWRIGTQSSADECMRRAVIIGSTMIAMALAL